VWPIVMYGCESWTLRKNEETPRFAHSKYKNGDSKFSKISV